MSNKLTRICECFCTVCTQNYIEWINVQNAQPLTNFDHKSPHIPSMYIIPYMYIAYNYWTSNTWYSLIFDYLGCESVNFNQPYRICNYWVISTHYNSISIFVLVTLKVIWVTETRRLLQCNKNYIHITGCIFWSFYKILYTENGTYHWCQFHSKWLIPWYIAPMDRKARDV
jgi:hypothetical protein